MSKCIFVGVGGFRISSVQRFQGLAYPCVQAYPAAGGQLLRQGLLNESVTELVAFHLAGHVLDQMDGHRLVHRLQQLVLGHSAPQNIQQPEIKLPSNYGSSGQHLIT